MTKISTNWIWMVSKRKCAHERSMEQSMMTEDKRPTTELGNTRKQMDDDYKLKQCSSENTLKDIDALQLILYQKDKYLLFILEENCLIRNLLNQQITSLLEEIKEKDSMIKQLQITIEQFDKFQEVKKDNTLDGLTVKLGTVIGEINGTCSTINELLVEARRNSSLSDTKNITLNIRQKGILKISTEE